MEIKMYSYRNIVKEMYIQRKKCIANEIQWELTVKILSQEICAWYESLKKRDRWEMARSLSYCSQSF